MISLAVFSHCMTNAADDDRSQWPIVIRTAVQQDDQITFHVGSRIVADSIPQHEYDETLHKAAGILAAA